MAFVAQGGSLGGEINITIHKWSPNRLTQPETNWKQRHMISAKMNARTKSWSRDDLKQNNYDVRHGPWMFLVSFYPFSGPHGQDIEWRTPTRGRQIASFIDIAMVLKHSAWYLEFINSKYLKHEHQLSVDFRFTTAEIQQFVNTKINFTIQFGPHAAEIKHTVIIKSTLRSTLRPILGLPLQK